MNLILLLSCLLASASTDLIQDLKKMPMDPPAEERAINLHFLYGNEYDLDLFSPYIQRAGGIYVGVGAEQNYHLAADVRPDLMVLLDYDEQVVMVHMIHLAFIRESESIDGFLQCYDKDALATSLGLLEEVWRDHPKWPKLKAFYPRVRAKLSNVMRISRAQGLRGRFLSFLSDIDRYNFIRGLARAGRILPMDGNLLGSTTLRQLSGVLHRHEEKIQILYLSNAEEYWWPVPNAFHENILSIPFAPDGLILRTISWEEGPWSADGHYHYNIQRGLHFQEALSGEERLPYLRRLLRKRSTKIRTGLSTLGLPESAPAASEMP